jgi:hypothetical protein
MAVALSRPHLRLPFGYLWKYGIVALLLLVAGYLIHFYSLLPCLGDNYQEHISPTGTYTVREHTSCSFNSIEIVHNQSGKVTSNLAARNWNIKPYNNWSYCPCTTRFSGWENDTHFAITIHSRIIESRKNKIPNRSGVGVVVFREVYMASVDAETGQLLEYSVGKAI